MRVKSRQSIRHAVCISLVCCVWPLAAVSQPRSSFTEEIEREILKLTNKERRDRGLPALETNPELRELARTQSRNMRSQVFFSHIDHKGRGPEDRKQVFFPELFGGVGENIAYVHGAPPSELAGKFIDLWMNSPGHRENMLRASFGHLGVGVVEKDGMFYATQVFGDLAARLLDVVTRRYKYGSEHVFSFKFLGKFPKSKISIFVRFPDSRARFYVTEQRFYTGMGVYKPE